MSGYRLWELCRFAAASIRAWSSDVRMRTPLKETAMTRALGVMVSARLAILTSWSFVVRPVQSRVVTKRVPVCVAGTRRGYRFERDSSAPRCGRSCRRARSRSPNGAGGETRCRKRILSPICRLSRGGGLRGRPRGRWHALRSRRGMWSPAGKTAASYAFDRRRVRASSSALCQRRPNFPQNVELKFDTWVCGGQPPCALSRSAGGGAPRRGGSRCLRSCHLL